MSRKQSGFTLIELMIVIAIIAVIAAIAIPNLLAARLSANETAAIATLRNLVSAQAQFQQGGRLDLDTDGTGEYGTFYELSGAGAAGAAGRMTNPLVPPVLSGAFRTVAADGVGGYVSKSGYLFRIWLPGAAGVGVVEGAAGAALSGAADDDLAETAWCAYAWPASYQQSGNRTFFVNQAGDILATEVAAYEGLENGPPADAGFTIANNISSTPALNAIGQLPGGSPLWRQAR